ncbi:efflux transporter outer membrane subunit [Azomonas macrocytogenes]|uniref:NodT family efflux transporter outer membrane factor (OMF) lipoprotein n=1 Tax=Azomonas macrocytogenes TaxID=69962 RepID=A0A839T215_AZOMA|nr:efflux transporter outer membrane subunit [Azomonas macrocytogenes]MBB3101783.1 NodT family efflux transporter outer membrane factor (OMF) lipoprotein [Azomonas macrocytogenes]
MILLHAFIPRLLVLGIAVLSLAGCTLGPDYERPEVAQSDYFVEAPPGWKDAMPADGFRDDKWWELYNDPELNALIERLNTSNQNIIVAEAQYRQAAGLRRTTWAALFPTLQSSSDYTRSGRGSSGGRAATSGGGYYYIQDSGSSNSSSSSSSSDDSDGDSSSSNNNSSGNSTVITKNYDIGLNTSWEADIWGRLRRSLENGRANAKASAADWAAVRLSQQSELVQAYMQLRVTDAQQQLLDRTVQAYARSLRLTENQYRVGIVPRSDVTQAQAQLKSAESDAIDLHWQRAQYEHAIAMLIGVAPSEMSIAARETLPVLPDVPPSLPSVLLERRPDVAAAERRVKAANASIGTAKAAWFPTLNVTANGGYSSSVTQGLLTVPNRYWSIAPQLSWTLFDFGTRLGEYDQAKASHQEAVATYRQTVLTSLQEVEDYMVQLLTLNREAITRQEAVVAAQASSRMMENQYRAGLVDYTDVVVQQTAALSSERSALTVLVNRLLASVQLIAALGGGWDGNMKLDLAELED